MVTGKNIKSLSLAIMILGLIFMFISFIQTDNINYVLGGLVIVSLGGFLNRYGEKKMHKN